MALESRVGVGEELFVELKDEVPMVKVPLSLIADALTALTLARSLNEDDLVRITKELRSYVNG